MKVKVAVIVVSITIMVILGIYFWMKVPEYTVTNINTVTLISFPSPPKYKTVNNYNDITKCVEVINSLNLTPTISTVKGWWFMIKIDDHTTITFVGDLMKINGRVYKINNLDFSARLNDLYESMNYPEYEWGK